MSYQSQEFDSEVLELVRQKGCDRYSNMCNFKKIKEKLPGKNEFYSSLSGSRISDKEHEHVLKVWDKFEMKTMKDYHDFYLKCDVSLLASVFENFRNRSLKSYGLCPSHYLSTPALN